MPDKKQLYVLLAALAVKDGVAPLAENVAGCWERAIDDKWWVAVNGTAMPLVCSTGAGVPPYTTYVTWLGWPAGLIDPYGGMIVAHPNANEDQLTDALQRAIAD